MKNIQTASKWVMYDRKGNPRSYIEYGNRRAWIIERYFGNGNYPF